MFWVIATGILVILCVIIMCASIEDDGTLVFVSLSLALCIHVVVAIDYRKEHTMQEEIVPEGKLHNYTSITYGYEKPDTNYVFGIDHLNNDGSIYERKYHVDWLKIDTLTTVHNDNSIQTSYRVRYLEKSKKR